MRRQCRQERPGRGRVRRDGLAARVYETALRENQRAPLSSNRRMDGDITRRCCAHEIDRQRYGSHIAQPT